MNISTVKRLNERIPYWMKRPFAGMIRNRLIRNPVFIESYNQLHKSDKMSAEEREIKQMALLRETLKHAYTHSTYYKKLFDEYEFVPDKVESAADIQRLPVLTKEILKKRFDGIVADDIDDYYTVTTGGSTGEPTKILMEKDAIYKEWAFIYHYWGKFGYDYKKSRLATFRGVDLGDSISTINPLYSEIRLNPFILNYDNINEYIKRIDKYEADFIYGYPSAIYNFCRIAQKKKIELKGRFKGALFISENLYEFQEELIKTVLDCPMVIFYGQSERAVFAERYEKGYQFNPLYGVTEFNEKGELVVTGFINNKTPLIRYLVDDHVEKVEDNKFEIDGHHDTEVLLGNNGEQITFSSINFHDDTFDGILNYQFVQEEVGKCILSIVPEEGFDTNRVSRIRDLVSKKLGPGYDCNVRIVENIPLTARGKHKMIVQKVGGVYIDKGYYYLVFGHRDCDVLYGANDEQISMAAVNVHDDTFEGVEGYQFYQEKPGECILYIKTPDQLSERRIQEMSASINHKLAGGITCTVKQTEELTYTTRGKYKMVIQKLNPIRGGGRMNNGYAESDGI